MLNFRSFKAITLLDKLNEKKFFLFKRVIKEFISPSTKFTYFLSILCQTFRIIFEIPFKFNSKKNILVWDIRSNPITFDFLYLIFIAFYKFGLPKDGFELVIYIPKNYDFRVFEYKGYNKIVSSKDLKKRIKSLILPLAKSYNCIKSINTFSDGEKLQNYIKSENILPRFYHQKYFRPSTFNYLEVDKIFRSKKIKLENFINPKKLETKKIKNKYPKLVKNYITMTLRDYGWSPGRNTTQRDIDKVYEFSKSIGYELILIPDSLDKIKNYNKYEMKVCTSARINISERVYLYANSYLNINPMGGPSHLSIFIKGAKTIILNWGADSFDGDVSFIKKHYNINFGEQPYLNLDTFLMWKDIYKDYTSDDIVDVLNIINKNRN